MLKPLPDIDNVYSMLVTDESQSEVHNNLPSFNSDSVAFSTGNQKPYNQKPGSESGGLSTTIPRSYNSNSRITFDTISSKRNTMICRYCKKPGHQIERCYKLHGFPSATSIGQPKFKKSTAFAQVSESQQLSTSDSPTCNTSPANSSISKEQFEQLLSLFSLFQQAKITSPSWFC